MRRRRPGSARRHRDGGNVWQIIYMDLMTIMMVYFVILWSADQSEGEAANDNISATIGDQTVRMVQLPGDVLFASGQSRLTEEGVQVFGRLLGDPAVLSFDTGGLVERRLVIHGHTDGDGAKDDNLRLGFQRAFSVYEEIASHGAEVPDHVVLCTHADNTPAQPVPEVKGAPSPEQREAIREAKAKNRRISIEDQMVNKLEE